jgi:hypothetical protein
MTEGTFIWRGLCYINGIKLKGVSPLSLSKSEVELVRLVVSKLKRVSPLSFSKPGLGLVRRIMLEYARSSISTWIVALI